MFGWAVADSALSVLQDPVRLQSLVDSIILPLGEELQGAASINLLNHDKDGKLLLPPSVLQEINGQPCPRYRINPEVRSAATSRGAHLRLASSMMVVQLLFPCMRELLLLY